MVAEQSSHKQSPQNTRSSKERPVLLLDCTQGSRKDSFARGVIACLKEKDRFVALIEQYVEQQEYASHEEHDHSHDHHSLAEVRACIDGLGLDAPVRSDAYGVYAILAAAEAKAHNVPLEDVHFHEVGNMEAVLWISISCLVMRQLLAEQAITDIVATPVCTGYGYVDCAHGRLPIPAPATANVLEGVPTFSGEMEGELTTPTGAALVVYYAERFLETDDAVHDVEDGIAAAVCRVGGR